MNYLQRLDQELRRHQQMQHAMNCALRVCRLPDGLPGVTARDKLRAVADILKVGAARGQGDDSCGVSEETKRVLGAVLAEIELSEMYLRLGITHIALDPQASR